MADSAVAVTAGSGTNIDTRTEGTNGNHRQVVVLGDPATNAGVAPVDATAGLKVDLGADNDVTVTSGTITTVSTVTSVTAIGTSVTPGTSAAHLGKAEDAAHQSGDTGVAILGVRRDTPASGAGSDGDYATLNLNSSGSLYVVDTGAPAVGQTTKSASVPVTIASDQEIAHDAVDSGNPTKVGGKATSSEPTAVADADRANLITDLVGKLITMPYAANQQFISGATSVITDTTSTSVIAAQGAGVRTYVTSLLVTNSDATVGTAVAITDGSGGTVLWRGYAAPAGGGFSVTFPVPLRTTANTALHAVCATTSAEVYVSASGYKGA
jgi:hypothetical protein